MLKCRVRHQGRRAARGAAPDFSSLEIARCANVFSGDEGLQRSVDGAGENLRRRPAHDTLDDAVDRSAVVEIAAHEGRVYGLCRHENRLQIYSLLAVKALVISEMKRQKADVSGLNPHPDFFETLRAQIPIGYRDQKRACEHSHRIVLRFECF